jgi:hypothetical protein
MNEIMNEIRKQRSNEMSNEGRKNYVKKETR